jgi:hypothetical protein
MINFRKTIVVGLAVTTLGMGVAGRSTPAAAGAVIPGAEALAELPLAWRWVPLPPLPLPITTAATRAAATSPASRSSTPTAMSSAITVCVFATRSSVCMHGHAEAAISFPTKVQALQAQYRLLSEMQQVGCAKTGVQEARDGT